MNTTMVLLQPNTSKEVYDDFKAELDAYREKVSSSMDLEKTFDAVGPINVDVNRTIIYVI